MDDLSQCHGLKNLGKYADVVVFSTNKSKFIDLGGGGIICSDKPIRSNLLSTVNVDLLELKKMAVERQASAEKYIKRGDF